MKILSTKFYRRMKYQILSDPDGTGFKLDNMRAVWLTEDSVEKADQAAKRAIDKRLAR